MAGKARDLERMHEQVVRDLRRVDDHNRRELEMSDHFLASMQVRPGRPASIDPLIFLSIQDWPARSGPAGLVLFVAM